MPRKVQTLDIVQGRTSDIPSVNQAVEVYWIARYDYHPAWAFRLHAHDFFQLILIVDGAGTARLNRQKVKVQANSVLFMPPYVPHSLEADDAGTLRTFDVKFDVLSEELKQSLMEISYPFDDSLGHLRHILEQLHQEAVLANSWYRELCNALMLQVLVSISRQNAIQDLSASVSAPELTPRDEGLREVLSYIHDHFGESELTLEGVSRLVGYSTSYLAKKFSGAVGLSLHRYIMRYRIYKAKELLRYSDEPIKEIAADTGFKTVHHFTRVFSEIEGMPPAKWRGWEYEWGRKGITISPRFVNVDITETDGKPAERPLQDPLRPIHR